MLHTPRRSARRRDLRSPSLFLSFLIFLIAVALAACDEPDALESIRQRQATGDFAGTLEPLRELLAERPDDGELNFLYGRALALTGEVGLATWPLQQALEDDAWLEPAGLQLAHADLQSGNFNDVVDVTSRILERHPEHATALLYRAQAHAYWKKDLEAALTDATRALEIDPDLLEAYEPKILALLSLDRHGEASEQLALAGRRLEETDAPASSLAWHCATTAVFELEGGDAEAAGETWRRCLEEFPSDPTVVSGALEFYDARGEFPRSLEVVQNALADAPGQRIYRTQVAARLRHAGDAAAGEAMLREATEVEDPRRATVAWLDLAQYRHAMREHAAAADAIERAIEETRKVEEPSPQILFQWADALVVSGQLDRALEVAEGIDVPAQRQLIRGRVAQERGDAAAALAAFDEALRTWPDNPWARYYTALAAEQVGDFDRALEEYRYAIRISVEATDARTRAARLLIAEGQIQRAYQLLFLEAEKAPLEPEGELLSMYLMARAANPKQLQNALLSLAERRPERLPLALARGAEGAAEIGGPKSALGLLRTAPGVDYTHPASAPALRELVRLAHAADQPEVARDAVKAALAAHPENADFREIEGLHLEAGGAPPEAVHAAYAAAVRAAPSHARALLGLGRVTAPRDASQALALFDRATAADPSDPQAGLAAARVLRALDRDDEAERRLTALLARHPLEGEVASELVSLDLARGVATARTLDCARRAARFGGGVEEFEQLSDVYSRLEDSEMAEKAARHAQALREELAKRAASGG